MQNPFLPGVGGVLSADIAVPDHEREHRFYTQVLTTGKEPLWKDDLTNNQGQPVIGLGARTPEYEDLPLQWMPHVQVADVAASTTRTLEHGGRVLIHAKGEDGESQWAVLTDPGGAAFGVVPVVAGESTGNGDSHRIGCIAELSLYVSDVASICGFYEEVVGWSAALADREGAFEMQRPDGIAAAEIRPLMGENEEIPSVWILSLPVDDFAESLRHVREGGGEVVKEVAGGGHAIIRDPVGVCFALQAK